jgi:hypothetical protein
MKIKIFLSILSMLIFASMSLFFSQQSLAVPYIQKGAMNGVAYATGGVGIGERQTMEKMAPAYNLKLVFAMTNGHYLADVSVAIAKPVGQVLVHTDANGPWLMADLPEGSYKIAVRCRHEKKVRMVEVGPKAQTVMFHWTGDSASH